MRLLPGLTLDQKYRIEKPLGEGAMGAVFQATHLGTTRPVAVKVIIPQLASSDEFAQRFKREAEAAGRLTHPNVVNVTDFGVTRAGEQEVAYLVMEYLTGESLADYLKRTPQPSFDFLLDVMEQAALGLDASHAAGIIHRDLKPSNIWLEPNHRGGFNVKLLDFGIAKVADTTDDRARAADAVATLFMAPPEGTVTRVMPFSDAGPLATPSNVKTIAGSVLGTPAYMAPEQCTSLEVKAPADVYSMAVIAYQMLCGRLPFEAGTLGELIRLQIQTTPASPCEHDRTVPRALADVVMSALDKDPVKRPPSAGTFAARLRAASEGELAIIRKSRGAIHMSMAQFLGSMPACLAVILLAIPLRVALGRPAAANVPEGRLFWALVFASALLIGFALQLFKATCALILRFACEHGHFRGAGPAALKRVASNLLTIVKTQFASLADLRPSSMWANALWPVVWALEGRTGQKAAARSRELCTPLRMASASLMIRQYGIVLIGPLVFPAVMAVIDPSGLGIRFVIKEMLAGSMFGWFCFLYPFVICVIFTFYGPAFTFLYWSALRYRNEGTEPDLPPAARDYSRKSVSKALRPATIPFIAIPLLLIAITALQLRNSSGAQLLQDAINDGRHAAVLKLIDGGMRVDHADENGDTPLFEAARTGDEKLGGELVKRGADVNHVNRSGNTPLTAATAFGRNESARLLLDHGAAPDQIDKEGRTALMFAAMRGNLALAQLLLEHGANAAKTDKYGKTAAVYAREEGYGDVASLLASKQ